MASSTTVPSDMDAAAHAESHRGTTSTFLPGVSHGDVQQPVPLPDICNPEWQRQGMPDNEFNRKYPPDSWGEEAAPNARVWKVYRDHQEASHNGMLEGWNKTLDVLLIFAGLFSAVSTAFLIESYKALQPDYTQYVAVFLYAAAVSHNRTGASFPAMDTIVAPDRFIQISASERWINGLWFSSLVISLAVALLCILIKQWLDEYDAHVSSASSSPKHWARRHNLYHRGLRTWGVPGLISFLPLLLHVSLFLFFLGLVLFLRPLDSAISYTLFFMVASVAAFYLFSLVLPAWRVECPSHTPLLAPALLAVSRVITGLIYASWLLTWLSSSLGLRELVLFIPGATGRLESIQEDARHQRARETQSISKHELELDGCVLSALIDLPTDTNRDVVNTALAAIGAITSTRTIEVISRNVPSNDFFDKFDACYGTVPRTETGFAITSRAQLRRAHAAVCIPNVRRWKPTWSVLRPFDLLPSLDIDGLLLWALDIRERDRDGQYDISVLGQPLQSLLSITHSSRRFPLRSTCLIFLEHYCDIPQQNPPFMSCFLLVFCAGRFVHAAMPELVRALQCVETVLRTQSSVILPAHDGGDLTYLRAMANGLWLALADSTRYGIDSVAAQLIASQAFACFKSAIDYGVVWAQLTGLSAFIRSPIFGQCMDFSEDLANYSSAFLELRIFDLPEVPLADYWATISTLLKLSWDFVLRPKHIYQLADADILFPVEGSDCRWEVRLIDGGPYATQDDWYEPSLSAFLDSPNALVTWTGAIRPDLDQGSVFVLAALARRISIVLCRRQHLGLPNDTFVRGLFSGSFLLARFRDFVSEDSRASNSSLERIILDLASHCLKLSQVHLMEICTALEETGDADSQLRLRAVAFAQKIRDGSAPGGALSAACPADCPCMTPTARAPPRRRTRWEGLVARCRLGRNMSVTPSNV